LSCAGATTAGFGPVCVDSGFAWGILVMEGIAFRGKGKNLPLQTIWAHTGSITPLPSGYSVRERYGSSI
jgi:hypothetical protein